MTDKTNIISTRNHKNCVFHSTSFETLEIICIFPSNIGKIEINEIYLGAPVRLLAVVWYTLRNTRFCTMVRMIAAILYTHQ